MTRFLDGPAVGKTLMLRRAPLLIRVTEESGQIDALDQLNDEARLTETLTVYRRIGPASWCHIRATKGGGFYSAAEYRQHAQQPDQDLLRSNDRWRIWATEQARGITDS